VTVELQGHVNIATDQMIEGWAVNRSKPTEWPLIEVWQNGRRVCAITPSRAYPDLLNAIKLSGVAPVDGLYVWHIPSPFSIGIEPDVPFDVRFAENGLSL
jgi:hypothetical protein